MLVTFDCYGTLLDTAPVGAAVAVIAERAGIDPDAAVATFSAWEDRLMYGGEFLPFEALIGQALQRCDQDLRTGATLAAGADELRAVCARLAPFADVVPTLQRLHDVGIRLGVVSNTSQRLLDCHRRILDDLFELTLCADEIRAYKPQDAVFDRIATWPAPGERHVHVAKGYWWDVEPAQRRHWETIWINRDQLAPLPGAPVPPQLPTLTGLPELLQLR
ncbi:MAG: HAD-IA family hydrolase [Pseudoclavibacter sp.]|jgi:2-haloacid dehalogenase